ncbi:otoferlin [Armigeres subalbatus]|uniref:otoferlin n=1 Tax=Armigeres subalbatus TaxID=124917 RepID=UPI002ED4CC58
MCSILDHAILQKWAALEECAVPSETGNVGFLQLDLSIVSKQEQRNPVIHPITDSDTIEDNLLEPHVDSKNLQRVKYTINIYQGEFSTKTDYAIQVSYSGIKSRTKLLQSKTVHEWNEKISFIGTFPSLSQTFIFDIVVSDCCHRRVLASKSIPFSKLSKQIDSVYSFPTFGPSYLYFYQGPQNAVYIGRLLMSISTEVVHNRSVSPRKCQVLPITTLLDTSAFWTEERFLMKLIIFNALVFDTSKPTKIAIALKCLTQSSNCIDLKLEKLPVSKVCKANLHEFPENCRPMLTVDFRCPDFRWKCLVSNALQRAFTRGRDLLQKYILFRMDNGEKGIQPLKHAMRNVLENFGESLKVARADFNVRKDKRLTHWDHKWMLYIVEQIDSIISETNQLKKSLSEPSMENISTAESVLDRFVHILEDLMYDEQNTFPDAILLIRHSTKYGCCKQASAKHCNHHDAICRLQTIDYMHFGSDLASDGIAVNDLSSSCGKRKAILLRPSRCQHSCDPNWCGCVYAKLDVVVWVGNEQEAKAYETRQDTAQNPEDSPGRDIPQHLQCVQCSEVSLPVQCVVNVHQGKIQAGFDSSGLSDPMLVVLMESYEMATSVITQSLSPLWNEVIEFRNLKLLDYNDSLRGGELTIMLLLLDEDKRKCLQKNDVIGVGWVKCRLRPAITTTHTPQAEVNFHEPANSGTSSLRNQSLLDNDQQGVTIAHHPGDKLSIQSGHHPQEVDNKISLIRKKFTRTPNDDLWKSFDGNRMDRVLRWVGIYRNGQRMADILLSVSIAKINEGSDNNVAIEVKPGIPESICPSSKKFYVQVLFAGLRDLHNWSRSGAGRYQVQVLFGELKLKSGLSNRSSGHSMSFSDVYDTGYLMLPSKFEYWPPLVVQHVEYTMLKGDRVVSSNIITHPELLFTDTSLEPIKQYLISNYRSHNEMERISIDTFYSAEQEPLIESAETKSTFTNKVLPALHAVKTVISGKIKARHKTSDGKAVMKRRGSLESEYTWWTKFYNSCSSQTSDRKHKLMIYPCELEKVPEFENFHDWSTPVPLLKKVDHNNMKRLKTYGNLKCKIIIRSSEENSDGNRTLDPSTDCMLRSIPKLIAETNIIVVVYIVQGKNLRSRDIFSLSDAYVKLEFGDERIVDRSHFIKDQSNPLFGRRFVMHGRLPRDNALKISVIDRDTCSPDDLIGSTTIDIEDRFRTRHFAMFGLPQEYNAYGYNVWRFPMKPSALLDQLCFQNGIIGPNYFTSTVHLAGITVHDSTTISKTEDIHERLALATLNSFHKIPVVGCHLVPEHVETRSLFHPNHPGIEQGQLQMWVEVYPAGSSPTLIDITPNPPKPFELRIIVWNTQDVILDERNIFGTKMSDIYVKCWLQNVNDAQFTDIHYRSLDGTGNFNWRMIFPLIYSSSESMMVVTRKKSFYEQLDTEQKVPPLLTVQVWDNDLFSRDDFLGTLNLDLAQLLRPTSKAAKCSLQPPGATKRDQYLNLFREDKVRGWYPIVGKVNNKLTQTGKIELELQILTEEEALLRPAGKGRKPPQKLPTPERPDTSFNWYRNPLKSFRLILWPFARKVCLILLAIGLVVLLCIGLISNTPKEIISRGFAKKATLDGFVSTGIEED